MAEVLNLFPLKIYRDRYDKINDLKEKLFPRLVETFQETGKNNNAFMRDGTLCSYHADSYLHKTFADETRDVVNFVENAARLYWKECNYHRDLEPYVFQLWANSTPTGGWVDTHLHGNMPFTGVIYVDANSEQGNLFIDNPLDTVLMTQPISPDVKYPMGQELEVSTGDLIMFPGFIKHRVKPNTTDKNRLVLGFNIGCRGNYWASQWTTG